MLLSILLTISTLYKSVFLDFYLFYVKNAYSIYINNDGTENMTALRFVNVIYQQLIIIVVISFSFQML